MGSASAPSSPVDRSTGLICDQTIVPSVAASAESYPDTLRRIRYKDPETGKTLVFLTNNFTLPALTITELYRCRWKIELFFKWIKQHLRIKAFYGTSENAVKTQIWIAISVYVLVAILAKRLAVEGISTRFYRSSVSRCSRKPRFHKHFRDPATRRQTMHFVTSCYSSSYNRTLLAAA